MSDIEQYSTPISSIRDEFEANINPGKVLTGRIVDGIREIRTASDSERIEREQVKRSAKARIARSKLLSPPVKNSDQG